MQNYRKFMANMKRKNVWVAGLKSTRCDNPKGTRIGPSLFHTSELKLNLLQ
jgi:hypothetical protein